MLLWGDRRTAGELWVGFVVFALGGPDRMILCSDTTGTCHHHSVQSKPWCFGGALTLTVLVGRAAGRVVIALRADARWSRANLNRTNSPPAGLRVKTAWMTTTNLRASKTSASSDSE